jgi:hypothetical protein
MLAKQGLETDLGCVDVLLKNAWLSIGIVPNVDCVDVDANFGGKQNQGRFVPERRRIRYG